MASYQDLTPTGQPGKFYSPYIERGSDHVPTSVPVPTAADLRAMPTAERYDLMSRYGWIKPADQEIEIRRSYLQRWDIVKGDDRYDDEMARLASAESKQHLLAASRRQMERHETLVAVDGKLDSDTVYLNEGSEPCEECQPLDGEIMSYAERVSEGKLPGDRCLGADNCLCVLMVVD
ncbi:MAG: hypothetical protein GY851_09465 [bacterium]|nr:hypothetical protein [bacterium]